MGCGRSGSTILGFVLGNGEKACDLGEVIDFLKRDGKPNSFETGSENARFWYRITQLMKSDISSVFTKETKKKLIEYEHHRMFLAIYLGLTGHKIKQIYHNFINHLYGHITEQVQEKEIFIDTSKYPSRALLLTSLLNNFDVGIVHLVRHPTKVVKSFGNKSTRQGYKGFISANIYYFCINLFCVLVKLRVGNKKYIKIKYEDIIKQPNYEIDKISKKFFIDLEYVKKMILNDKPLKRGFPFNGNRMRMQDEVVLKKNNFSYKKNIKNLITMFINAIWY